MELNEERCAECILWKTPGLHEYCCKGCKLLKNNRIESMKSKLFCITGLFKKEESKVDDYTEFMKNAIIESIESSCDNKLIQLIYSILMESTGTDQSVF